MSGLGGGGEIELPKWLLPLLGGGRPGGRGEGRRRGRASRSRSRRLLRSPSSLALTGRPAAPWGGLRTLVGGMGEPFRPPDARTLRGGAGPPSEWGEGRGAWGEV